jgi:Holliday junction resolvase RusA-like endonuclease
MNKIINKPITTLKIRLPEYKSPRLKWRKAIHDELLKTNFVYPSVQLKLELLITLYLPESDLKKHDVDNRLKDIMDALQGRIGGSKRNTSYKQIIQNDNRIYRVTITKQEPPKQSRGLGHLTVRKYKGVKS